MAKYRLARPAPEEGVGENSLLSQLLFNRGLTDEAEIAKFLNPDYDKHRHDPFLLNDMQKAVERILLAIKNNERIAIYSDYDCDGIPGGVVLHDFFKLIGYDNFQNHIPHRHYEGFGLNSEAVMKLAGDGVSLIVTIDCGTSDIEAIEKAVQLGVDVIVTDHHEPPAELPPAVAIVNPKVGGGYPFDGLCGAGVIFKVCEALLQAGEFEVTPGKEKWLLDMVGIATIADMVPLRDENRVLAKFGLTVLRKSRRPGLQHLLRKAKASQAYLTEDDIGFTIGPRINAASRMDNPEDAFFALSASEQEEAFARVEHLEKLNNERKGLVAAMTKELKHKLSEMNEIPKVIVLGSPEWRPALVGLAANSLSEEFKRPAFLWGRDGNGVIKGSCRAGGESSVVKIMEGAKDAFLEYGGHHASGGFSVKEDAIFTLPTVLNNVMNELGEGALADEEVIIDAELRLSSIDNSLLRILRDMAPFGVGNQKPLFAFKNVKPLRVEVFGKAKEHLKLVFDTENGDLEAISFFTQPEDFVHTPKVREELTLLAHVEESFFMGRKQTRLRIIDIVKDYM